MSNNNKTSTHTSESAELLSFEQSIERLKQLAEHLESNDVDLDDALKFFEEGVALAAKCQKTLSEAAQKVNLLVQDQKQLKVTSINTKDILSEDSS